MNKFIEFIPRYIRKNKKKTAFISITIIISIILLIFVNAVVNCLNYRYEKNSIYGIGNYHARAVVGISDDENPVKNRDFIKKDGKYIKTGVKSYGNNKTLEIGAYEKNTYDLLNMTIKQGRYPRKQGEIALEQYAKDKYFKNARIGDEISLSYTKRDGESSKNVTEIYTVVGILNSRGGNDDSGIAYAAVNYDDYIKDTKIKVASDYFRVKNEADIDTDIAYIKSDIIKIFGKSFVDKNVEYFSTVDIMNTVKKLGAFLTAAVAVCVVVVIYNIFHITVIERIKEFSMLKSIGTDKRQIMMLVLGESFIITLICIPIGTIAGYFGIKYLFLKMITLDVGPVLNPKDVVIPIIVSVFSVFISSLSPAVSASKISPVEGIKESYNINKKMKIKKKNIHEMLGFSFSMALCNIVKNKKRFVCTILSFAMSIFLLICSIYIFNIFDPERTAYRTTGGDLLVSSTNTSEIVNCGCTDTDINNIKNVSGIKNIRKHREYYINLELDENKLTTEGKNFYSQWKNAGENLIPTVHTVGADNKEFTDFKQYLINGTVESEKYDGKPELIVVQNLHYRNYTKYKVGDTVTLYARYKDNEKDSDFKETKKVKFKVGAVLRDTPIKPISGDVSFMFILSNSSMEKYFGIKSYDSINIDVDNKKDINIIKNKLSSLLKSNTFMNVTSIDEQRKSFERANYVVRVILLSFCIMMLVVSVVNIINTIGISVLLRKKELGMLRAVGVSRQGIRKIIIDEGMIYGVIGSILGLILSVFGTYLIYLALRAEFLDNEPFTILYISILLVSIISIAVSVVVSVPAARKATKETIVESIKTIE